MQQKTLSKDITVSYFAKYKKKLNAYLGETLAGELIDALGGDEAVIDASFATTSDTGLAYNGSFCQTILNIASYAIMINDLLPEDKKVDKNSIVKVALLSHIAKVVMFEPNDNTWEVDKRGMVYKFRDIDGALRTGERSILIAMNAGVKFNEFEYEAMRIMDKSTDDDNYTKYYSSMLSVLIRQANEIVQAISKI